MIDKFGQTKFDHALGQRTLTYLTPAALISSSLNGGKVKSHCGQMDALRQSPRRFRVQQTGSMHFLARGVVILASFAGRIPAFIFKDSDLKSGPKVLYACLCAHADERGHCWRSWGRLAVDFGNSRKQVQRWFYDLERAGYVTRIGWRGKSPLILVIRDPAGRAWAQSNNVAAVIARRCKSVPHGKEGARRRWQAQGGTQVSTETDTRVPQMQTPMSPKHNLPTNTHLTKEVAWQEGTLGKACAPNKRLYGLKRFNPNPKSAVIHDALNRFADKFGWERAGNMDPPALAMALASDNPGIFTEAEALAVFSLEPRR